ncbi:MAG: hypothetical protein OHK0024_31020 [Thalassobaculales bacterium]
MSEDIAVTDATMARRRAVVLALNLATVAAVVALMARLLGHNGWTWPEAGMIVLFAISAPWSVMGFWNAAIGFCLLHFGRDPLRRVNPLLDAAAAEAPITARVALALAVRNEDPAAILERARTMLASLDATGWGHRFDLHVLSDSSRPAVIAAEEAGVAALAAADPRVHYRRRPLNTGFKAGNLREFAERAVGRYDFMIVLDADSLMTGQAMLRLVRIAQAHADLGILQTLVVGRPSDSAFARMFQFGMRHGMRSYTMGATWWQGDSGPYWGHNAIIRLRPFVDHCHLPVLPGRPPLGGVILSHDQVEAAMMRGAGFQVRVIPDEVGSWEENPPSLPDFIKRDLRWCQGNMQYWRLLGRPGFRTMGRFQLLFAVLMYLGAPAWVGLTVLGVANAFMPLPPDPQPFPAGLGLSLFAVVMTMVFAPKIAGVLDVLLRAEERRRYGGGARLLAGFAVETLFSLLTGPVMLVAEAIFMAGLLFGRRVAWEAQNRVGHYVPLAEAARGLWPQALFGLALAGALYLGAPGALPWAVPVLASLLLAIPFTSLTSSPWLGRQFQRLRLCAIPDEYEPAPELSGRSGPGLRPAA